MTGRRHRVHSRRHGMFAAFIGFLGVAFSTTPVQAASRDSGDASQEGRLSYTAIHTSYEPDGAGPGPTITECVTVTDSVYEVLHAFTGGIDGSYPLTQLVQGTDGDLYGTTPQGGMFDNGVIFRMTPDGYGYTILHEFTGRADGASPYGSLVQATDGGFYGTTRGGGNCCGTLFRITPDGAFSVLYSFNGGQDGASPQAGLLQASDGNFYGTTTYGGGGGDRCFDAGCGTAFKMTPDGHVTVLYSFTGAADGAFPATPLIEADDGNFYGTTMGYGGDRRISPTAFQLTPDGVLTVLHYFPLGLSDEGVSSPSALVQASDGDLYGTTSGFSPTVDFGGTAFRLALDGTFTFLHGFGGPEDGRFPRAGLIQARDGNFYGTTLGGGGGEHCLSCGSVFEMTPDGTVSVLHAFDFGTGGNSPDAGLVEASDGTLYGTTQIGGAAQQGVVFRLTLVYGLVATPETVTAGDPLTIQWSAPPGRSATDWIALYPVDAPNTDYVWWQYTNGASCGSFTIAAPDDPGEYEFRYLVNDSFIDVARSNRVTVIVKKRPEGRARPVR